MSTSEKTLCVAGASGLVGSNIVKACLDKGYRVHGTMRDTNDPRKAPFLQALAKAPDNLQLFDADMAQEGAFDAALNGADCVFMACLAERYHGSDGKPSAEMDDEEGYREIIRPIVDGCLNIMRSAKRQGVENVVICSSTGSTNPPTLVAVKNEFDHWSDPDLQRRQKKYNPAAKTIMEKTAMQFARENGLRLSILLPTIMLGPVVIPAHLERGFHSTVNSLTHGERGRHESTPKGSISMIHLYDVAALFLAAYENARARGRYFALYDSWTWKGIYAALADLVPAAGLPEPLAQEPEAPTRFDFTRRDSLGVNIRNIPATLRDTVEWIRSNRFHRI